MGVLAGKVAVVTGASRGIGAAIAVRLAAEGAKVVVAARTVEASRSPLEGTIGDTVARIEAAGGTAFPQATDLSREQDREALIRAAEERYGPVDILVNNAAVTYFTPVSEFTERRYDLMFEVQVNAPFHLAQLVIPGMRERRTGWILNISSVAARHPTFPPGSWAGRGSTVYGMCKAALERFTTGLAAELYADNVAVNALSPNRVVPTPGTLFHGLTTDDDPNAEPPTVMADAALALCHRPAAELTGRIAYSQDLLTELQDRAL
ncbi:SDR family NAD(P)-dependent oxidoreductase [Nonomuraea jiangxiensis]|uniref:NADP-dependent 3-hydroxy acid dehydrogenase YdfG n=1 Tax=Nonomuraea jiangxiensis TaxID=633440 RepID=A0A1G9DAW2_9ACTN|nr:SDR family NAD(P)-dependent oxidoreductase [Nonomuraea jiangxiensis]SDK61058.1 NADP-dependent 3-hydroxy acid dehydrogenase YdfG [Nonomuraea jiangxiensis]